LLEPHHEVVVLIAVEHRGGAPPARRPVKVSALVHDAERELDARKLSRPHIAGNSLGGWIAIDEAEVPRDP
jgi:pimeloyl-ACP methyl ester carboxylesterase